MTALLIGFVAFLLVNVLAALWRVVRGPSPGDRLVAPQLLGTTGIAALLVAADALASPALRDVALLLALLAVVTTAAFALRVWGARTGEDAP